MKNFNKYIAIIALVAVTATAGLVYAANAGNNISEEKQLYMRLGVIEYEQKQIETEVKDMRTGITNLEAEVTRIETDEIVPKQEAHDELSTERDQIYQKLNDFTVGGENQ